MKMSADWRILAILVANIKNPGDCFMAETAWLSEVTGLHPQTVKAARADLVKRGYLIPTGKGAYGVSFYRLGDDINASGSHLATELGSRSATAMGSQSTTDQEGENTNLGSHLATEPVADRLPASTLYIETGDLFKATPHTEGKQPPKKQGPKKKVVRVESHPVFDEWRIARKNAGMSEPTPGSGNITQAKKLAKMVPDADRRQRAMTEFFNLEDRDGWIGRGKYQLWQFVNHKLDTCLEIIDGNPAPRRQDIGDLSDLPHAVEQVERKYGPKWAKWFDAKARELKSTAAARGALDTAMKNGEAVA